MKLSVAPCAGEKFGRLALVEVVETTPKHGRKWRCRCSCGKEKIVREYELTQGSTKSCGCLAKSLTSGCHKKSCVYWAASGCNFFMATGHTRLAAHRAEDGSTNPRLLNNPCKEYTPGESAMRLVQPFTIHKDLR